MSIRIVKMQRVNKLNKKVRKRPKKHEELKLRVLVKLINNGGKLDVPVDRLRFALRLHRVLARLLDRSDGAFIPNILAADSLEHHINYRLKEAGSISKKVVRFEDYVKGS